jgi:flagellar motor switch protein FliM
VLLETEMKLRDIMKFREGDVIPMEIPEQVTLKSKDVPIFRGQLGMHKGNAAIKILKQVERPFTQQTDIVPSLSNKTGS